MARELLVSLGVESLKSLTGSPNGQEGRHCMECKGEEYLGKGDFEAYCVVLYEGTELWER